MERRKLVSREWQMVRERSRWMGRNQVKLMDDAVFATRLPMKSM
jgi:hypothetical protein